MEDTTITLNAEKILKKTFTPNVKGYDPDEVDDFLDLVAADYVAFENYYRESKKYIVELETRLRKAKESNSDMELELAKAKKRIEGIREGDSFTTENITLIQRIQRLETELYHLGIDPKTIK